MNFDLREYHQLERYNFSIRNNFIFIAFTYQMYIEVKLKYVILFLKLNKGVE